MPESNFGPGTDPGWIVIVAIFNYLPQTALIFLAARVFVATPIRIKLNHYPRYFNLLLALAVLVVHASFVSNYYRTEVAKMKAREVYIARHPTKVLKRYSMLTVLDQRVDEAGGTLAYYFLVEDQGRRILLPARQDDWEKTVASDTVEVRFERRSNPAIGDFNDKYWVFKRLKRAPEKGPIQYQYGKSTRSVTGKILKCYRRSNVYCLLLETDNSSRLVQDVAKADWLGSKVGDRITISYKRINKNHWRVNSVNREVE